MFPILLKVSEFGPTLFGRASQSRAEDNGDCERESGRTCSLCGTLSVSVSLRGTTFAPPGGEGIFTFTYIPPVAGNIASPRDQVSRPVPPPLPMCV